MPKRTLYETLMIDARADAGIITLVYHALAKRYHPDRTGSADAAHRMVEINEAYAVLSDPASRERYDQSIGIQPRHRSILESVAIPIQPDRGGADIPATRSSGSPYGEAGSPPAYPRPRGRVMTFGRYAGWALNQVEAHDPNFIDWLERTPTGRMFNHEIGELLRQRVSA